MGIPTSDHFIRRDPQFFKGKTPLSLANSDFLTKYQAFPSGYLDFIFNPTLNPISGIINPFPKDGILHGSKLGFYYVEALEPDDIALYWGDPDYQLVTTFFANFIKLDDYQRISEGLLRANTIRVVPRGFPMYALTDVYTICAKFFFYMTGPTAGGPTDTVACDSTGRLGGHPIFPDGALNLWDVVDDPHKYLILFWINVGTGAFPGALTVVGPNPRIAGWTLYKTGKELLSAHIVGLSKINPNTKIPPQTF